MESYGPELLSEYIGSYLREEIIAEALVRNVAGFSHFLDLAALSSWGEMNYSTLASDSEIPKETLRRFEFMPSKSSGEKGFAPIG